jgi:CRP-like cAMP-binding protein
MDLEPVEHVLASVPLFEALRPDELARIAPRFQLLELGEGQALEAGAAPGGERLVVLVSGGARLETSLGGRAVRATLDPGDRFGEVGLASGHLRPFRVVARRRSVLATLDRPGLERLLHDFPAVALPLAGELASELRARNDAVRQLLELHAERFPADQLASAVAERRRVLSRQRATVRRLPPRALFRKLVVEPGSDPPFWMLAGFAAALALARLTVFLILRYHLEAQLFALVPGRDPHPVHVHHFNYGLVLVAAAGLAALFPLGRRALRVLAFCFGAGCGLVLDEFGLLWRLNPEYAQASSLVASGVAALVLAQLVYFRRFWQALARRGWRGLRGWR